jgi:hypothetical protein
MHNNFRFLVNSGASLSILLHADMVLPTGPHLVRANGKTVPAWGFRRLIVCFSGQNYEFNFLLATVDTPLLGMDFLTHFGLSIIPSKQQVLYAALGRTFSKTSTSSFVTPWSSETPASVAALPPRVQQLLKEFPTNTMSPRRNCLHWKKQV